MFTKHPYLYSFLMALVAASVVFTAPVVTAGGPENVKVKDVHKYWTKERRAAAIPRDLVIDHRGLGYLRRPDGLLVPHGHNMVGQLSSTSKTPMAKPPRPDGDSGDTIPPDISNMNPAEGDVIGASHTFSATITDASGIKSVSFVITYPDGINTQSFSPESVGNDTWEINLQGFTNGNWSWHVVAKDKGAKGGNSGTSDTVHFTVDTGSGDNGGGDSGGDSYIVTNAIWEGGAVATAAGRIYFEMPGNSRRRGPWSAYVCSGTVMTDNTLSEDHGRSIIITAAHCVYDDVNKAFARNVLFIPAQHQTTGSGTDTNCDNDPFGCWAPSFGVVDVNWATDTFPSNKAWDYAYYVVNDVGAHSDEITDNDVLDAVAGSLPVSFGVPLVNDGDPATSEDFTYALGYSYSDDPNLMYCAEDMTTVETVNWWLPSCGLSGGSSGGPWVQSNATGNIISVNSWGYTTAPGMAGPMLVVTSAECLFGEAKSVDFISVPSSDGDAGLTIDYCP